MTGLSLIVTLHREGRLAHPTLRSLGRAVRHAGAAGLSTELLLILDRPDPETLDLVAWALSPTGALAQTETTKVVVDFGDEGLSRNLGVDLARYPVVGTLDADNLICRTWLTAAHAAATATPELIVFHPSHVVIFDKRRAVWPMVGTDHPDFRPHLLSARNQWDTFAVARKEVYRRHRFAATPEGSGLDHEDWHWHLETLAGGIEHRTVPATPFFYRAKRSDAQNAADRAARRALLPRTRFLTSRLVAESAPDPGVRTSSPEILETAAVGATPAGPVLAALVRLGLSDLDPAPSRGDGSLDPADLSDLGQFSAAERAALSPALFNVAHYRLLHPDLVRLGLRDLVEHYLRHGRVEGRRGTLDRSEVDALEGSGFSAPDYLRLHADLAGHTAAEAVAHFLRHGRYEGRSARGDDLAPGTTAPSPLDLPVELLDLWREAHQLEPLIPYPAASELCALPWTGAIADDEAPPTCLAYWAAVRGLPERVDTLVVAAPDSPRDAAALGRLVAQLRLDAPADSIAVVLTGDDKHGYGHDSEPEHEHGVVQPAGSPRTLALGDLMAAAGVPRTDRAHLLGTLVLQHAPRRLLVWNSGLGCDAVEAYGPQLAVRTQIHLRAGAIVRDPERGLVSPLLGRRPGFLDPVERVLVDDDQGRRELAAYYPLDRHKIVAASLELGLAGLLRGLGTQKSNPSKRSPTPSPIPPNRSPAPSPMPSNIAPTPSPMPSSPPLKSMPMNIHSMGPKAP